jgi:hypothetical protein
MRSYAFSFALLVAGCDASLVVPRDSDAGPTADAGPSTGDAGPSVEDASTVVPAACEDRPAPVTSALAFDGADDGVAVGPVLGLTTFTVEAWVRRDGLGTTANTGVGGLNLVPIAGKGRGENDGSNVDCNYAFGFNGDRLGADFEDMESGANHPITGSTAVTLRAWHHVAATYDGTTWRLYLDGRLDGEASASATPRGDSIQHFGIGTALNSSGTPAGRFAGLIDEVRVWDRARTEAEIASGMRETITTGEGLLARFALDEADGGAPDSVGGHDGTIEGATFVSPGAVLDRGAPPVIVGTIPANRASLTAASTTLEVAIDDAEDDAFSVTFHLRALSEEDDFTIAVLPDTQYYTRPDRDDQVYFYDQTQWIMDNREAYDIAAVIHNGDMVDHGDREVEFTVAERAMETIEVMSAELPDGLPWGLAPGNHDEVPNGTAGGTALWNRHFGVARFEGRGYYGGHYSTDNDENWFTFTAGGLEFVVVSLQYDTTPDAAVIAWARSIFLAHPDAFGILNSHYIVNSAGQFGVQGQAIYDGLRDVDNLQIMTNGHISAEARRTDRFGGNAIHSMLADYQFREESGSGWMRVWEFSPAAGELTVRTYSPTLDRWETDANSEFTLPLDLTGAGAPFMEVATVDPTGDRARATIEDLEPGHTYEWYATVSDCSHSIRTPVSRFTTSR